MQNKDFQAHAIVNVMVHMAGLCALMLPVGKGGYGVLNIDSIQNKEIANFLSIQKELLKDFPKIVDRQDANLFDNVQEYTMETLDKAAMMLELVQGFSMDELQDLYNNFTNAKIRLSKRNKRNR